MVHFTPIDFAATARAERDRLVAQGTDPGSIIFMSEFSQRFPQQEGESNRDFSHRRSTTMQAMVADDVVILNDQGTGNRVPDVFPSKDGRTFDLGPNSGVTKGEYREFTKWFYQVWRAEAGPEYEVPERWLKFVRPREV
jgi:hypothetical protein